MILKCIVCGIDFYSRPCEVSKGRRYCSKPCKGVSMVGKAPPNKRHGLTGSPTWKSWDAMKQRCLNKTNKDYANYGGRGIVVCEEWKHSFDTFLSDMGEKPQGRTLGRINNSLGYSKGNCRWETPREQNSNRRSTRTVTVGGRTQTMAQWARELGVPRQTIRARVIAGWSPEMVVDPAFNKGLRRSSNAAQDHKVK